MCHHAFSRAATHIRSDWRLVHDMTITSSLSKRRNRLIKIDYVRLRHASRTRCMWQSTDRYAFDVAISSHLPKHSTSRREWTSITPLNTLVNLDIMLGVDHPANEYRFSLSSATTRRCAPVWSLFNSRLSYTQFSHSQKNNSVHTQSTPNKTTSRQH